MAKWTEQDVRDDEQGRAPKRTPCYFVFDDSPAFPGFAYGTRWNGFDNVAVTPETHAAIVAWFKAEDIRYGMNTADSEFTNLPIGDDGLISYAFGFTTQIINPHAICAKWISRLGLGFHPDTRGADYTPDLSPDEVREYDRDMGTLFVIAADPYECALLALQDAGLDMSVLPPARDMF